MRGQIIVRTSLVGIVVNIAFKSTLVIVVGRHIVNGFCAKREAFYGYNACARIVGYVGYKLIINHLAIKQRGKGAEGRGTS